jgi:hypothetical protein
VFEAFDAALNALDAHDLAGGGNEVLPYAETFTAMEEFQDED